MPVPEHSVSSLPNEGAQSVLVVGETLLARGAIDAIRRCGLNAHLVENLAAVPKLTTSARCSVALVCFGKRPSLDAATLEAVRHLCQRDFTVLTCGIGAGQWPVGHKCLPLLAGAFELLDTAAEDFLARLQDQLKQSLRAATAARAEKLTLRKIMGGLGVVGESPAMVSIFRTVVRVSGLSDVAVLLTGETGTGKGLLAQAIHGLDPKRRAGPFVAINCGAVSAGLAESELFGHRRGAFTGADRDHRGLFRAADGGVLFLDEIGDLEQALQVKLLRVLEEGRVLSVGEDTETPVDVRVIAATNRDPARIVTDNVLRSDLFHRLNVLRIDVPPLRERPSDLCPLISHFLAKHRMLGPSENIALGPEFIEALAKIELPGNVRQLEHIVCQALVKKSGAGALALRDLPPEVWRQLIEQAQELSAAESAVAVADHPPVEVDAPLSFEADQWQLSNFLDSCERLLLERALHETHGNQSKTALLLGITPRSVYNKRRKHRLRFEAA
jgi:transcriptional regulator with GAF, ATPase, and Fis domain